MHVDTLLGELAELRLSMSLDCLRRAEEKMYGSGSEFGSMAVVNPGTDARLQGLDFGLPKSIAKHLGAGGWDGLRLRRYFRRNGEHDD